MKIFFSVFTILFLLSSCTKELSFEIQPILATSSGTAVYTFAGAQSNCTSPTINGNYIVDTAMNSLNTVTLQVNVTKVGSYQISTAKTNGITFVASGNFTSTGLQQVTFMATGAPILKGSFVFNAGNKGCSFTIVVTPVIVVSTAAYSFPLAPNACAPVTINGNYMVGLPLSATNTVQIQVNVTTVGTYNISTVTANGISFNASGNFTTLGVQLITLKGSGQPLAAGAFNYSPSSNGCSFTITALPAAPPATFTLQNNGGTCTTPIIGGTYAATQALTISNTVQLVANVTVAGSYNITTNSDNGITFSASGNFAATGAQPITFTGSGTPTTEGDNIFTPLITSGACAFTITTVAAAQVSSGILTCKIDGVLTTFNIRAVASLTVTGQPGLYIDGFQSVANNNTVPEFQLFLNNNDNSTFKPGTYDEKHFIPTQTSMGYRIEVDLLYQNSDQSFTRYNTASNFTTPNPPFTIIVTSISATRVKGTFSGKMTNIFDGSTIIKTITEGSFDEPIQ